VEDDDEPPGLVDDSDSEDDRPPQWNEAHRRRPKSDEGGPDGSERSRSAPKLARVDAEEEPPGVVDDSDSEDDRPSRWEEAPSRRQPSDDDVPDLIDDWLGPTRSASSATHSQHAPRVRRPPLALPPGVSPQEAYAWACGLTGAPPGDTSSASVSQEQAVGREDTGRADDIKRRSQASRGDGMETSSAAGPLTPLEPGAEPHAALLWATRIATEAEEIMNATLLISSTEVLFP
jgi:hypothetical protein